MAGRILSKVAAEIQIPKSVQVRCGHHLRGKPPTIAQTLVDRLAKLNAPDPTLAFKVNIGFSVKKLSRSSQMSQWRKEIESHRHDPEWERRARELRLMISLDEVKNVWNQLDAPQHIKRIANHYGVFQDLFGDAYFYPVLPVTIEYQFASEMVAKVYTGNVVKPKEAETKPHVSYRANDDALFTLVMSTPDGNMINSNNEMCHWFVGNIPGSRIDEGERLIDYLKPIPIKGVGYYRYVFVVYKQNKRIDYSAYKKPEPCSELKDRDWNTYQFYRAHQDHITPCGLAFFQSDWDNSVRQFYHEKLGTEEPIFQYDFPKPYIKPDKWFPLKEPFNLYMDKYKDPRDVRKRYLLKKLKDVHPFKPPKPPLKFPNAQPFEEYMPTWLKFETMKERLGWGRINDVK